MKNTFTNGWLLRDMRTNIATAVDYTLNADEKRPYISVNATAASKSLVLGVEEGDMAIVANVGATNAITIKNLAGDTGTSLAAGKIALVVASETANATVVTALN